MARNKYGIAKRSIWYILKSLLIVAAIVALCLGVFIEGLHASNLYILVTEGMAARADTILNNGSSAELTKYFTEEYLNQDQALYAGAYEGITVSSYDYRLDVKGFFVLPWSVRATMTVDEHMAAINAAADNVEDGALAPALPEWEAGRYQVIFLKVGSRWYINSITLIEKNPAAQVKPTPDMSLLETSSPQGTP